MSPYVRKVLAFAAEKGLPLDSKPTRIGEEDADFRAASPFGKMPALVDGEYRLADSSAIIHYLEAKYPEPSLIPADPQERGRVIWFEEFADTILMGCLQKMFFNRVVGPLFLKREGKTDVADAAERDELPPLLTYLEQQVPGDGFLVGGRLTLADIAVASPLANLRHMEVALSSDRYPRLAGQIERVLARPSFADWLERESRLLDRARNP